jgi:hypothetical protein
MNIEDMIYRDGYIAYVHDHAKIHNPYPINAPNRDVWNEGWQYAKDEGVAVRYIRSDAPRNAEDREG